MPDIITTSLAFEFFCHTFMRFPIVCGSTLCAAAAAMLYHAQSLETIADQIDGTTMRSLSQFIDEVQALHDMNPDEPASVFVVTRGVVNPAALVGVDGTDAVILQNSVESLSLTSMFWGMLENDPETSFEAFAVRSEGCRFVAKGNQLNRFPSCSPLARTQSE